MFSKIQHLFWAKFDFCPVWNYLDFTVYEKETLSSSLVNAVSVGNE